MYAQILYTCGAFFAAMVFVMALVLMDGYYYRLAERRVYLHDKRGFWRYTWDWLTNKG